MRKLLYAPFGIIAGAVAGRIGRALFDKLWARFDTEEEPPSPKRGDVDWRKAVGGAALEAAAFAGTRAAVDRVTAKSFHHLTGLWPEKPAQPEPVATPQAAAAAAVPARAGASR